MTHYVKIFFLLAIIFVSGCKGNKIQTESKQAESKENIGFSQEPNTSVENENWVQYINEDSDSLHNLYTENAIKILPNESRLNGNKAIKSYYLSDDMEIAYIHTDTILLANQKRKIEYEMGDFYDKDNQKYKHIIIWITTNGQRKRDFEFVTKVGLFKDVKAEIDDRRNQWMKRCNAHDAKALISDLYSANTLYYNHKPLIVGRDLLVEEYQYMNNEKYQLTLTPILSEQVNKDFVFEIGQCKGSYNSKYIIIWRKSDNDKWKVFIDSNI
jgi:ketosteroid isomerase-like protein